MSSWLPEVIGAVWGAVTNRFRGGGAKWLPFPTWTKRWLSALTMAAPVLWVDPWMGLAVLAGTFGANSLPAGRYLGVKDLWAFVLACGAGLAFVASAALYWAWAGQWWAFGALVASGLLKGPIYAFDVYVLPPRKSPHRFQWREILFGAVTGAASGFTWS